MPIELNPPLVIPSTEEKIFSAAWVRTFRVNTERPGVGSIVIETVPHNPDTGETLAQPASTITADLWEVAANVPSAGSALAAVLAAVPDIIEYIKNK